MATHKSAMKRDRQNKARYVRNKTRRSRVRSAIKAVRMAISEKDGNKAREALASAIPFIDEAASKGVIHKNTASRKISRLTRQVNALLSGNP